MLHVYWRRVADAVRYVMKRLGFIGCWSLLAACLTGCVYALRPSNPTTRQSLQIQAPKPERYAVRVADAQPHQVASDGQVSFDVPPLQSGCAVYLCGLVKVADHRSEDVRAIQIFEGEQVVRRLSLNQISNLPTGLQGIHILKLK
jgi:hypothetical protein